MKAKTFFPASRLAALALATITVFTFSACSGDDDEPSVDDILSTETTPIEFEMPQGTKYFFDYAGNNLVASSIIKNSTFETINLRQGKHHLLWLMGIDKEPFSSQDTIRKDGRIVKIIDRVNYDPETKMVSINHDFVERNLDYAEKELEVTPYLMPTQHIDFTPLTCEMVIVITDKLSVTDGKYVIGCPVAHAVGVTNDKYVLRENQLLIPLLDTGVYYTYRMLCPLNGYDEIQLEAVSPFDDETQKRIKLPVKFSLRRGYTTVLRGPLFSGSSADWTVTMEPYKN